jgi:hypothetical protein
MNEEAIKDAYNLFVGTGYKKSYEEFKQLIASNPEALNDAYGLFVKTGYTKDINSFKTLMGVGGGTAQPQEDLKKKEESVTTGSPSDDSSSASQKPIKYDFTNLGKPKDPNEALGIKQVKDVDFAAIAQKEKEREAQKPEFYRSLEKDINPSLMQKTEEVVVPEMQYKFGPLGFKFEEWDPGSNTMRVTAPDGKSQEYVRLKDNDPEEMRKLQRFIDENTNVPGLKSLEKQYAEENKKFNTDEEVSAALKSVTDRVTVLNKDVTGFLGEKKLLDEEKELIEGVPAVDRNTPQYKQRLAEYNAKATALETKMKDIVFREEQIKADAVKLEKAVGKYTSMKAEQGSWPGGLLDSFMRGIGKISAGEVNAGIDVMFSKYTLGVDEDTISSEVSESKATGDPLQDAKEGGVAVSNAYRINEIYNRATEEQRAKGVEEKYMTVPAGTPSPIPMPSAGQSYKDWWNSLSPDQREAIVDKSNDDIKKDLKVNLLPAMRTGAEIVMGDPNTTVQWADLKKQGFWGGAILGVTESLPAMIGANTTMGWAQRTAAMYAQTTDAVYEEMSKNPAFDDISESEKLSVLAPIGITGAVLGSIGLRNLVSNKGLMNRIILGAIGRAGATTTAKTFGELVENEVDSMIARGLITASGAMLAEAETGAAQQISEYAYKEIYNAVKGKDMFQTPDFLSAEYIKDVAVAGAQEAVGGFVLGVPSAVSAAYQKKGFLSMDDAQFEFFRAAANDEKIESAYVAKLKQNVVTGKTTIKEAKEALNNYRNSVGLYRSVPEELSTQDAKEAMNLLREKRELEKQKEGKDEALVKRQTNRITEINSRLEELSSRSTEDATAPEAPSAPSGNRIQVLTDEEEERRLSLEQAVGRAMSSTPDGLDPLSVLVDGDLMSFQDAQQELQTLNEKANAVQEPSTESVLSREQGETAEAGGERGQMGQGVQGQEVTQEGGQEKVGILSSPETITVALEQLPQEERTATTFMQEDGTETPVMGNEKMLADLYSAASQVAEQDRTSGQQSVINAVEVSLKTQLDNEAEQARIEQERSMEGMKATRPQVARAKKTVASNVIKSMRSVFPDLKISTHRNAGDMRDYAQRTFGDEISSQVLGDEGGMIVYDANNKPIAILVNDEISDATTMPHEAWHGILIKAFGRNEQLFAKFRDAIKKRLVDNGFSEISDQLDEFSQTEEYAQSDSQAEEWMAQLGGLLTASGITPDNLTPAAKTLLGQIKEVFNSIAEKITGSRIFLEDATPDDVLDFMVAISDRMRRGESVSDFFKSDTQQETGRAAKISKQTKLEQIQKISKRYNVNNDGFAPKQVDERALSRELAPFGYSAKRAKVTADGYGGGVYIVDSRGRVFNPFRTSKQRASSAARLQTGVESIAGYDRMMSEIDGIIAKSKSRGRSKSETAKNVMEYMMGSAVYEKATDVQRDQMVRDINERFGISMKSAPSVGKLFGTIKDVKKITMSEKQLLKKQIRDLARGAKDAKVAAAKITDMLTRSIKAMSLSGSITNKQVSSVIRRFGKVNVFSQESIDKFVEYMANVFEDANYDEKISAARKLSKKAKANIKTKIGASDSIASDLRKLFSINPLLIPAKVMDRYMELLESFGASSAVLSLENINEVKDALSNILKAINNEVSAVASLSSRFEYYEDKVFTKDGKLLYTETIDQMLEQGVITKEDYDLMSKYRSEISPAERESMTEEEIEAAKKEVIQGILSERIDPRELSLDDEVNLARKISQLLDRYLLEKMTLNQLKNLEKLIGVINNGYMPGAAQVLYQELLSTKESLVLDEAVSEAKPLSLTKMYSNLKSKLTRKDATLEMIRRNPLFFIDQLFGDFKTKRIFDSVFSRLAQAQSAFESSIGRVNKRLDIAHDEVAKSFGYKANETIMSSFKMMTYMLQLEYETNPESNQVNPAAAYLKETIKYLESKGTKISNREADMLREILKHYSSYGEIDAKKLYQSFNSAEKKAIAEVQDINKSLEEKASYTAAVIRGKRIDPLNNYIHHFSRGAFSSDDNASATELANIYNASMNPSTKAMNLMERQKKPTPISFDLFASAQRGAKFTLLDYHMTEPLRVAKMTVNKTSKMIESNDGTDLQKQVINAVSAALSESASNVLINNFVSDSLTEMIINYISKQGYRAVLASAPRFVAELSSNIAFATIVDPKSFSEGVKYKDIIMSPLAVMVMDNVKSKSTTRLFHGDTLSGRFIDRSILSQSSGVKSAKPVSVAEEKANMIYNMSLKKYKNFVELVSDALISTPDKMVMRPIWFGSFATEFKRQTGKDVDFNKIAEADSDYMNDNAEAIESAREYADGRSVMAGASDNAFMGILKGTVKPDQGAFVRAFNNFNNFMTRFTIYEYITARQGLYAAMGDGSISRKEGVAMVAGVTTRMTVYTLLSGILGNAMLSMFADEEEDDEKTFMQKFSQALSSAMVSLVVGRDFGNATKSILNYGVEELNEEFLTGLRNGDYDPYKDAISFSVIPRDKGDQRFDAADLMARMSGSFGPTVKTSVLMMKKMSEPEKKEADAIARSEDEKNIRIPLEVLGNAGLVPLYKDIRKIVMKEMYKELENADKKAADKKQAEKEMLHGYENKTEMKRYNPELYEEVFGEGSPGYNEAQAKKNIKKEKEKLERQMKDDFYNYQPNKKSSNAFGSKDFGKGKDKESKSFGSKKFGE